MQHQLLYTSLSKKITTFINRTKRLWQAKMGSRQAILFLEVAMNGVNHDVCMDDDKISSRSRWNAQCGNSQKIIQLLHSISRIIGTDIPKARKAGGEAEQALTHFQLPPTKNCKGDSSGSMRAESTWED